MKVTEEQKTKIIEHCTKGKLFMYPEYLDAILEMLDLSKWMEQLESQESDVKESIFFTKEKLVEDLLHTYEFCVMDKDLLFKETKMAMLATMFATAHHNDHSGSSENKLRAKKAILNAADSISKLYPSDSMTDQETLKKIMVSMGHIHPDAPRTAHRNKISAIVRDVKMCYLYNKDDSSKFKKYELFFETSNCWNSFDAWRTYFFTKFCSRKWETKWGSAKAFMLNFPRCCNEVISYIEKKYKDS